MSASQRIALLRVLQEALSNIRQHSGGRRVLVTLCDQGGEGVWIEIRDDGHGFDPAELRPAAPGVGGLGLPGMRARLRLLGGQLQIQSRPGGPTTLKATLPHWQPTAARSI